jgi:hypothetical protein
MFKSAAQKVSSAILLSAVLLLQFGCASKQAILREEARDVAAVAKTTVADARAFYSAESTRVLDYYLTILSEDPNCPAVSAPLVVRVSDPGKPAFRCLTSQELALQQDCEAKPSEICKNVEVLDLAGSGAAFQSVLTLVDVIGQYQSRLAEIAAERKFDTAKDLTDLRLRAENLKAQFDALLGRDAASGGGSSGKDDVADQIAAVGPLIDVFRTASDNREAFAALQSALSQHGPALESALTRLASRYSNVDLKAARLADLRALESRRSEYNAKVVGGKAAQMKPAERFIALSSILKDEAQARETLVRPNALALLLTQLSVSHSELREAVINDKLTPAMRLRIAERNLEILKATFKAITGMVKAFG